MGRRLKTFFFTIDLRSLGLYRLLLASLLVLDWLTRWPDLEAFYTSSGVLPVEAPLPRSGGDFHFCLLDGVRSLPMVQAAFLVGLACYVFFLIGYRTRAFQVGSFVVFTSVLSRNILIRDGSVVVIGTLLLWSLFLPMGRRFSIDTLLECQRGLNLKPSKESSPCSAPSFAAFAIVAQIGLIYFFTAGAKHGPSWKNGTALYYALSVDQFVTDFGRWVAAQPLPWIKGLTWGTLALEFAALPLILLPFGQPYLRRVLIVSMTLLHLGIAATMRLGSFSAAMICSYALLLSPRDWDLLKQCPGAAVVQRWADRTSSRITAFLHRLFGSQQITSSAQFPTADLRAPFTRVQWTATNLLVVLLFAAFTLDGFNLNLADWLGLQRVAEPRWARALVQVPLLPQDWELFAPDPMKNDGWWVIDGELQSGEKLDPLTGRAPNFDKPPDLSSRFDGLWRKYLNRIWLKKNYDYRLYFGRYLTRKNHRDAPEGQRLVRFDFYYVKEPTQPPGTPQPWPTERLHLWHHECYSSADPGRSESAR